MNSFVIAVLVAGLLPIVCSGIAKRGQKDYDNHNPRAWLSTQGGHRARDNAAQQNSFEAFPLFAAAVVMAWHGGADTDAIATWSWIYVALRVAYIYCYVADRATLRSLVWIAALGVNIRLFFLA